MINTKNNSVNPPASPADFLPASVREELSHVAERYAQADDRFHRARVLCDQGDLDAAADERREAMGNYYAVTLQLADLFLLLLRYALKHRPLELRAHLTDLFEIVIGDDLDALADAIVELRERRQ